MGMSRAFTYVLGMSLFSSFAWGQAEANGPRFDIADVHSSPKIRNPATRNSARGGRYEIKQATMVDLIRLAYGFNNDKILGGPSWLELDRFDVVAKLPDDTAPNDRKQMLQALLADRFKLVSHKDTKPLPAYALTVGKKPLMKEADGDGEGGCKPETASGAPAEGGIRLTTGGRNGQMQTINLGPGFMIHIACRNITMAAFATELRGIFGVPNLGSNLVLDQTGLKGKWNFDLRYSLQLFGPAMGADAERISFADALEKQAGLKLEEKPVPTEVLIVDSVNRQPAPNPPGIAEALPAIPAPTEFEVADVKPTDPSLRIGRFQMQPGGRLTTQGTPLHQLVIRAFNTFGRDEIVGLPNWADTERFDITAKAPSAGPEAPAIDNEALAPMLRALLADRFKMKYHTEEREVSAYSLVAGKPKLKKADPNSRTSCKQVTGPGGPAPGSFLWTCQNVTMEMFAERLQNMSFGAIAWPVKDETGLEGAWDLSLTFSPNANMNFGPVRGGDGAAGAVPTAADPSGMLTIFEAMEKQLGLKLESQKRSMPVIVIDHIEQKPTDN